LPVQPSLVQREEEIQRSRKFNLKVDDVLQLPFPEDLNSNWVDGSQSLLDVTLKVVIYYAVCSEAQFYEKL